MGPTHVTVAHARTTLGIVFRELGQFEEAKARHERSLAILEKALGPKHPVLSIPLTRHCSSVL